MNRFRVFTHHMRSLDFKVLAIVGLVILAMGVGSLLLFKRLADQAESLLFDAMDAMSFAVHYGLMTQIHERYFDLHAFASSVTVQAMDVTRIPIALNKFVQLYGIYDVIIVTDSNGRYVSSNTIGSQGKPLNLALLQAYDFSREPWFQVVRQGGTYIGDPRVVPYLQESDRQDAQTTAFATAVKDEKGQVIGAICTRAGVRWIHKVLDRALDMFHAGGFSVARLELINASGQPVVVAGDSLRLLSGSERPVRYPGTQQRSRTSKIWSLVQSEEGDLMVGSSFLPASSFVPDLRWSVRLIVGSSSASRKLAEAVRMSYGWIILASTALLFLAVAYLQRLVISRHLQNLVSMRTAELKQSTENLEQQNRELEKSKQELVTANQQLIEAQKELLDTAKRLGQSEVAALTLHNIGNIVTSLNIQSTLLREHMEQDAPGQLTMAYLKKIEAEGRYPDGIKSMIGRLAAADQQAYEHIETIMRGLIDNVRMAMAAISSQLSFVHQNESAETYKLSELLQHTLILYFGTFKRYGVQQTVRIQHDASFSTERYLFESILTVLIRNALDAVLDQEDRRIVFATELDEKYLTLSVQDNGHGFDEDTGSRIFRFGFSTKSQGHGFGLHYAANSCQHLGLELSLTSPGVNQGATARIQIPRERLLTVMDFVDSAQGGKEKRP